MITSTAPDIPSAIMGRINVMTDPVILCALFLSYLIITFYSTGSVSRNKSYFGERGYHDLQESVHNSAIARGKADKAAGKSCPVKAECPPEWYMRK